MTKYDTLEELTAEVKLKQLLWDSLEEWESLENGWLEVSLKRILVYAFESLDFFHHLLKLAYWLSIQQNVLELKCNLDTIN